MKINSYLKSLSIYKNLKNTEVLKNLIVIFDVINSNRENISFDNILEAYSAICIVLYENNCTLDEYIKELILCDENIFSVKCADKSNIDIPVEMRKAAYRDIQILSETAKITSYKIKELLCAKFSSEQDIIKTLPDFSNRESDYSAEEIVRFYRNNAYGDFAKYIAFKYCADNSLKPVKNLDDIKLCDLKLYDSQRNKVIENTLLLLNGSRCNNVLLYGDRGTGKSSTVKAVLNEYHDKGLRMIQLIKDDLIYLPELMEKISHIPLKFIIFIDDLTFNENDYNFGAMKTVLEGSLNKQPENTAIYVTTNRRHLIKETFSSREGDEVHKADTIDETLSLSDRFGLTITFSLPNKDSYLEIVRQLAQDKELDVSQEELYSGAERFALLKSARTPRLAKQYVDYLESKHKLAVSISD